MTTPHKHAAVIHAFADGAQVQSRDPKAVNPKWTDCRYPDFDEEIEYRIKPAAPVVETKMDKEDLRDLYRPEEFTGEEMLRNAINVGIARAIADGQVVSIEESDKREKASYFVGYRDGQPTDASRAKRDMAVAKCMLDYFNTIQSSVRLHPIDAAVQELIARVN